EGLEPCPPVSATTAAARPNSRVQAGVIAGATSTSPSSRRSNSSSRLITRDGPLACPALAGVPRSQSAFPLSMLRTPTATEWAEVSAPWYWWGSWLDPGEPPRFGSQAKPLGAACRFWPHSPARVSYVMPISPTALHTEIPPACAQRVSASEARLAWVTADLGLMPNN